MKRLLVVTLVLLAALVAAAPDARICTVQDGVVVPMTLAEVAPGRRVTAQGVIDRTVPDAPVFRIKWMRVGPPAAATP